MGGQTIRLMEEFLEMVTKKKLPIIKRMVEKYHHYSLVVITIWLHQSQH